MWIRKLYLLVFAAAALTAVSCKKDDDTKVLPSLNGSLTFYAPEFIAPGQKLTMTPKGVSHPEGGELGYYWKVTPGMSASDTTRYENGLTLDGKESDGTFSYTFPDTLGTYTISAYAFAKGYSGASRVRYATVVIGDMTGKGSITENGIKSSDPKITVDGIDYYYTNIAGLDWFRHNLANPSFGAPYNNDAAMGPVFGRYYSYEEAVQACPEGWRLPTDAEWVAMAQAVNSECTVAENGSITSIAADLMADAAFNGMSMWEYWPKVGEITNKSGLAILPCGFSNLGEKADGQYPAASFSGTNEYSVFWTADKVGETMANYRYVFCEQPDMVLAKGDITTFGASVRCVR